MKRSRELLTRNAGCVDCRKPCNFNTLTTIADSQDSAIAFIPKGSKYPNVPNERLFACNGSK